MPPKKHTSAQDKKRIYDVHMRGEDAILLGRQLSIKENSQGHDSYNFCQKW